MIELINVEKKFKENILFSNVNMKITNPGVYCFIGENGCGKTTLLNIIAGFIKSSKGKVIRDFRDVSFISQKVNLLDNLTVKDHFKMFGLDFILLKKVNLYSKLNKYPRELSFGMRQRIAVLIGLYSSSSVVICDEPTSHLDNYNSLILMRLIKSVSKYKVVLLVSHDKFIVDKYSDVIYKIENREVKCLKKSKYRGNILKQKSNKIVFKKYIKEIFKKNRKINFYYLIIIFILVLLSNLIINLESSFTTLLMNGSSNSLEYNKFYLKECERESLETIVVKKCFNVKEDKINKLKESDNDLKLNLEILLNDLYDVSNLVIFNNKDINLKEGRYPFVYNEVIASSHYNLGDEIVIETSKVINKEKIDIYKNKIVLKIVGICYDLPFVKENKLYLYSDLIENHLKKEYLKNNNVSLYDYFNDIEVDNYKYVLFFNKIDLEILELNNIDYVSSSYEYYESLEKTFNELNKIFEFLLLFICIISCYHLYKLVKKKVKNKEDDISFFKASGFNYKKIIWIINIENMFLIILASLIAFFINYLIINFLFDDNNMNCMWWLFSVFSLLFFSEKILKREVERKILI